MLHDGTRKRDPITNKAVHEMQSGLDGRFLDGPLLANIHLSRDEARIMTVPRSGQTPSSHFGDDNTEHGGISSGRGAIFMATV